MYFISTLSTNRPYICLELPLKCLLPKLPVINCFLPAFYTLLIRQHRHIPSPCKEVKQMDITLTGYLK